MRLEAHPKIFEIKHQLYNDLIMSQLSTCHDIWALACSAGPDQAIDVNNEEIKYSQDLDSIC